MEKVLDVALLRLRAFSTCRLALEILARSHDEIIFEMASGLSVERIGSAGCSKISLVPIAVSEERALRIWRAEMAQEKFKADAYFSHTRGFELFAATKPEEDLEQLMLEKLSCSYAVQNCASTACC